MVVTDDQNEWRDSSACRMIGHAEIIFAKKSLKELGDYLCRAREELLRAKFWSAAEVTEWEEWKITSLELLHNERNRWPMWPWRRISDAVIGVKNDDSGTKLLLCGEFKKKLGSYDIP